jgi:threonine dehydrogenase-like Zn-dependent dehydrogenase
MKQVKRFKKVAHGVPAKSKAWRIYGKGMENFGDEEKPTFIPVPEPQDDELLVRNDAIGLCFSDTKIIKAGSDHPRIRGRDLKKNPVIPGHEVALTVVKVGKDRRKDYKPGERFIIQADVRYRGTMPSYGYVLPGGLSQYGIIGKEILDGDDGSYLIPLRNQKLGYSELALVEPWGCVVAAYRIKHRTGPADRGTLLIVRGSGEKMQWGFSNLFVRGTPARILLAGLESDMEARLREALPGETTEILRTEDRTIKKLAEKYTAGAGFDDIIILGDAPNSLVEEAGDSLRAHGILNYMVSSSKRQVVAIDAGKVHYDVIAFIGSTGEDVGAPYAENPDYTIRGGSVLMIGAGGPMGQMHVKLAMEQQNPPKLIIATDIDDRRLQTLGEKFSGLAKDRGISFHILNPGHYKIPAEFRKAVTDLNGDRLFDYVVCLAAIPAVIEDAASYLGDRAVLNIFAGVSKGTIVRLDIKEVATKAVRFIGSSGSSIDDMEFTLRKLERGELDTNSSVAGVSGMNDVWRGIDAVRTGSFAGKIVVYPHIRDLDLISLQELGEKFPKVKKLLSSGGEWNREAEEAFLEEMLELEEA